MFTKTNTVKETKTNTPKAKKDWTIEKQIVKAIAIRVGIAVTAHFAAEALISAIDKKAKNKTTTNER